MAGAVEQAERTSLSREGTSSGADAPTAAELCERYAERVYRFAAMVSRGDVESDDLAQDALERAIRRLNSYEPERGTIEAWLWRIVVSAAADAGRLAKRRHLLAERMRTLAERTPADVPTPAVAVSEAALLAAVRRLAPRDRSIIALRFGAGLEYAEVGAALGMTAAAAGVAGRRALARLRADLEKGRRR